MSLIIGLQGKILLGIHTVVWHCGERAVKQPVLCVTVACTCVEVKT